MGLFFITTSWRIVDIVMVYFHIINDIHLYQIVLCLVTTSIARHLDRSRGIIFYIVGDRHIPFPSLEIYKPDIVSLYHLSETT